MLVKLGLTKWIDAAAIKAADVQTLTVNEYDLDEGKVIWSGLGDLAVGDEFTQVWLYFDNHTLHITHPIEVEAAITLLDSLTEEAR